MMSATSTIAAIPRIRGRLFFFAGSATGAFIPAGGTGEPKPWAAGGVAGADAACPSVSGAGAANCRVYSPGPDCFGGGGGGGGWNTGGAFEAATGGDGGEGNGDDDGVGEAPSGEFDA